MYMWYLGFHVIAGVSWMVFLLSFIRSFESKSRVIFNVLSLISMIVLLLLGIRLILLNPSVAKSGGWLHTKLSFVIILMLENLYLSFLSFKKKNLSKFVLEVMYWFSYILLVVILALSFFRPF